MNQEQINQLVDEEVGDSPEVVLQFLEALEGTADNLSKVAKDDGDDDAARQWKGIFKRIQKCFTEVEDLVP